MEFVCVLCGEKFTSDWKPRGGNRPRFCPSCRTARKRAQQRHSNKITCAKRKAERAEEAKANTIVRRCRRCGKKFEQLARPRLLTIQVSSDAYVLRSYCKSCSWAIQRAARACDSRFAETAGFEDVLDFNCPKKR